jgi:hypothetical protein
MPEAVMQEDAFTDADRAVVMLARLYSVAASCQDQELITRFNNAVPDLRGCVVDAKSMIQPEVAKAIRKIGEERITALGSDLALFIRSRNLLRSTELRGGGKHWLSEDTKKILDSLAR